MAKKLLNALRVVFANNSDYRDHQYRIWAQTEYKNDWQFAYHYMMTHNGNGPRMGVHN